MTSPSRADGKAGGGSDRATSDRKKHYGSINGLDVNTSSSGISDEGGGGGGGDGDRGDERLPFLKKGNNDDVDAGAGPPSVWPPAVTGYESASIWSNLVFGWIAALLQLGNEKDQLDPADLLMLPLPESCQTDEVSSTFDKCWQAEVDETKIRTARYHHKQKERADRRRRDSRPYTPPQRSIFGRPPKPPPTPSLALALFRAFGKDFLRAGLLKLVHDLLIFVGPQVLDGLIGFLRDADAPLSRGVGLTAAVTVSQLLMSFCLRHYFWRCYRVGLRVRTAIVMAVYRKALVLSASERQTRTTGEITNLISVDAQRLQDLITYLHAIWYSGLQILLALYFLWQQLGPSCLGGVAVIIVMMPVTKRVAKFMGRRQKRLMAAKDTRVDINNEVLGSMKVIKFQAWEESFSDKINELRRIELHELLKYMVANSLQIMLWSAVPLLVALSTFAAYVWMGNVLDVAVALTSLALFEILRFPLFMLPQVINNIVEAMVSLDRVRSFLLCGEHGDVGPGDLRDDGTVRVDNASFVYDSRRPANLEEIVEVADGLDPVAAKKVSDDQWEMMLLRSQLADAECRIRELLLAEKREGGESGDLSSRTGFGEDVIHSPGSTNGTGVPHVSVQAALVDEAGSSNHKHLLSLRRVTLECKNELIAVVGAVGAGKSTLINSILGEVRPVTGTVAVKGRVAYFAQSPFIMNETLRDNVIFGRKDESFNKDLYRSALSVCALKHDLTMLPNGDLCEIGEKGITLSGGQKARVAMARVVYHDADITLLDDPLAAVDAHVGRHLFQQCIVDKLLNGGAKAGKKRTVILVTNALQYLSNPNVDRILVLKDGRIAEEGTYARLTGNQNSLFSAFLQSFQDSLGVEEESSGDESDTMVPSFSATSLSEMADVPDLPEVSRIFSPKAKPRVSLKDIRGISDASRVSDASAGQRQLSFDEDVDALEDEDRALTTDEFKEREVGHVSLSVYLSFFRAAGGVWTGVLVLVAYAGAEGINVLSRWWLTYWSLHGSEAGNQTKFLAIYAIINLSSVLASFVRLIIVMLCGLRASKKLFSRLLEAIMQAQMAFFDTTPVGRIVNRFSKDMYTVDEQLLSTLRSYLGTLLSVFGVIVVISSVSPIFTVFLLPMIAFYGMQQNFFTKSYRELKRLDSVSRSPLYALLGETLDGISTIRAFAAQTSLVRRITNILDKQQNAYFLTFTAQCYLAVRLELVGTLIIAFACICAVAQHGSRGGDEKFAGLAGLSISFALSVTQSLNWSVRMGSDLEANMIAVERIEQYCNVPSEAPRVTDGDKRVSKSWPNRGEIVFDNVKMRYRSGLPLVLKGLKLVIPAGSKVGVVGRTGAGKSTLMVALLRIVELDSGTIFIDGCDIRSLGLSLLRSKIAVIPQDPVLFTGTVRTNLDPFNEYDDHRLYEVLGRVGLTSTSGTGVVRGGSLSGIKSLSDTVYEGGSNLSVGQRQLLVIARALLGEASIVIMDEATAAVDAETDTRIQRVMRTDFKHATCITVAHRLNTIMDSDLILVMDGGRAAEFDPPASLLAKGGMFKELVDTWEEEHGND